MYNDSSEMERRDSHMSSLLELCKQFTEGGQLLSAIKPSPLSFCYHGSFQHGDQTQLHTHDYFELA